MTVSVPVTNTGDGAGSEVVQCYVAPVVLGWSARSRS